MPDFPSGAKPLTFHPASYAQFVALHLARRFDDLKRLPQYLDVCERHSPAVALAKAREAASSAETTDQQPGDVFLRAFGAEGRHP